ncbi:MAG: transcriptional repressor [Deltaproteobacteria bacterium]|nr:transcriptional repressor [Deltaproteobacteria bacterium]
MQTNQTESPQDRLRTFETRCRREGLKLTHQRLEIFRELASTYDHPSANTIYQRVQTRIPTISLDTVYRTLLTFEDCGLVARVPAFDDQARFDADLSPHQHLACTECKRVEDLHWEGFNDIEPPPKTEEWGDIKSKHVVLRGICKACLKKKPKKSRQKPMKPMTGNA